VEQLEHALLVGGLDSDAVVTHVQDGVAGRVGLARPDPDRRLRLPAHELCGVVPRRIPLADGVNGPPSLQLEEDDGRGDGKESGGDQQPTVVGEPGDEDHHRVEHGRGSGNALLEHQEGIDGHDEPEKQAGRGGDHTPSPQEPQADEVEEEEGGQDRRAAGRTRERVDGGRET
jgi:hypothetical protein